MEQKAGYLQLSVPLQFLTTNVRAVKITAKNFQNNDWERLTYFEC